MNKMMLVILVFTALAAVLPVSAEENFRFISISATVLASDPNETSSELARWAEEQGGYFTTMSTGYVILRFPYDSAPDFREVLEETCDDVYSYSSTATDLRESILTYQSGIEARMEILARNLRLVDSADFSGTLYLEQEILRLMSEIEALRGSLRKAENDRRMAYAYIQINFQAQTLPDHVPSSFEWINTIDFYSFLYTDFSGRGNGSAYRLDIPEGFALVANKRIYQAVSPEGVRFQIREEKNYPRMEVDFWSETFEREMTESGYQLAGESTVIETGMGDCYVAEWGVALGTDDFIYLTAVLPHRNTIYIIEAAGEYRMFRDYRDAVIAAIESLR
jgi:hypothetical protein